MESTLDRAPRPTFNHGVPGSIPGGPTTSNVTIGRSSSGISTKLATVFKRRQRDAAPRVYRVSTPEEYCRAQSCTSDTRHCSLSYLRPSARLVDRSLACDLRMRAVWRVLRFRGLLVSAPRFGRGQRSRPRPSKVVNGRRVSVGPAATGSSPAAASEQSVRF